MRFAFPFRFAAGRSLRAVAALVLLAPLSVVPLCAQTGQADQHAALSSGAKTEATKPDAAKPAAIEADAASPQPQPGVAAKALDKVKQVAKSASDIFHRVPCHQPTGVPNSTGSLPHVAAKLAAG